MTPEGHFAKAIETAFPRAPHALALAVSGGGDSMALLHIAADWARGRAIGLHAATVDHGLRPEAEEEAARVADAARALGVPHTTLRWTDRDGQGNLQDVARRARRALIEVWAAPLGVDAVLTGHTMDDQAETVLMRLARGSGVDGLAGIAPSRQWVEVWLRPLLAVRRAELREWLRHRGIAWSEDPSNDDPRFDRVRARQMMDTLSDLGLTVERLAATARHMRLGREVLDAAARDLAGRAVTVEAGDLVIDEGMLAAAPADTRMRFLAAALQWVSRAPYRPRYAALERLADGAGGGALHGCLLLSRRGRLRISREHAAVADLSCATDEVWDGRWRFEGPHAPGLSVRALTARGLALCPHWRETGMPAASLEASPAVWSGPDLVAAPLAGMANGWAAKLTEGCREFALTPI